MSLYLYDGLVIPVTDEAVETPSEGFIVIFAKSDKTVWVKYPSGEEEEISV